MKTRKIVAALAAALLVVLFFSACPSPTNVEESRNSTPAVVNIAAIPGVTVPATYRIPVTTITETAQYRGTVSWSPTVTGVFTAETAYTATITLTAKAGYTLEGVTGDFFTLAGATSVSNTANSGTVTAVFPETIQPFVEMTLISAGDFQMGSPTGELNRQTNENQHKVTLGSFYMGKYEVTQAQWYAVMGTTIQELQTAAAPNVLIDYGRGDNYPVYYVSWYDAIEFCNKLSEGEGLTPYYTIDKTSGSDTNNKNTGTLDAFRWLVTPNASANGYRLPTEAQWEYACRAGTTTAYNTGSNTISDDTGWYSVNSGNKTHEVGQKTPNNWGLYDMHGNVHEWCWDWYGAYPSTEETDPIGASSGSIRVLRGGSWYDAGGVFQRSAYRVDNTVPSAKYYNRGIRVVRPGV